MKQIRGSHTDSAGTLLCGKDEGSQQTLLGQLDNHVRVNESGPLAHTVYKN